MGGDTYLTGWTAHRDDVLIWALDAFQKTTNTYSDCCVIVKTPRDAARSISDQNEATGWMEDGLLTYHVNELEGIVSRASRINYLCASQL